ANHRDCVAFAEPAGPWHLCRQVEAVGDCEQLGQYCNVGGQAAGNMEDRCMRAKVEIFGPPTEQVWCVRTCQRVSIVLQPTAEVVRIVAATERAFAASRVGSGYDAVADLQR